MPRGAGNGGFAASLKLLATPCPGNGDALLSPDLASDPSVRGGYRITLRASANARPGPVDCHGVATATWYYAAAEPILAAREGSRRAFATDASGTIWVSTNGLAPRYPFVESASVKPLQ